MNKKILLIGGGGHCRSVLDSLLDLNEYAEIGIIDQKDNIGRSIMGIPVVGCDDDLPVLFRGGYHFAFVALGSIGDPFLRIRLFEHLENVGYTMPVITDDSARVSRHAEIGPGVFVGKQCIVNAGAVIGKGAIINSGSIIEHDCRVGAFAHIAPGAVLSGEVTVGGGTHIGANAVVKQQVRLGAHAMIGMGSVVLGDFGDHTVAYGNPCREVRKR